MKKSFRVIAVVLALCMVLCSCGKKDEVSFGDGLDENGYFKGIKASDYVTLNEFDDIKLDQSQIDAAILELCTDYGDETDVYDRAVVDGDKFYFDFIGKIDGVEFDGGSAENASGDLRNNSYIPGLLEGVIGHYPGEIFDVDVTFPEDYGKDELNGKAATFTIKLLKVVDRTPAEFTDELVQKNFASSGYTTTQEIIDFFKVQLLQIYIQNNAIINEIPEAAETWAKNVAISSNKLYAKNYYQVEEVTYLKQQYGVETEEEFLEMYKEQVLTEAQTALMFQAIAEKEGIKLSDQEVKDYVTEAGSGDMFDQYIETFGMPYYKMLVTQDVITEKLLERCTLQ